MSIADEIKEARYYAAMADMETAQQRIDVLEEFVQRIEDIETQWVTGLVDSQTSMSDVSAAWRKVRRA